MGVRTEGTGHGDVWKILIGLSVACAVLVFVGGFLHRRALDAAIADRQAKSVAFVNAKVADVAKQTDLSKPLKEADAAHLTKQLDLPAGTDLRLFSNAGVPVYTSPGVSAFPADAEGIQAAAGGDQARVIDGSDLRVYAPVDGKGAKPAAIAAVVSNYSALRNDASGPLDAVRLPIVGLGVVLLVAGLLLMLQATKGAAAAKVSAKAERDPGSPKTKAKAKEKAPASSKGRVTGFDPVPVTVAPAVQRVEVDEQPDAEPSTDAAAADDAEAAPEPAKPRFGLRLGSKKPNEEATPLPDDAAPVPSKTKRTRFGRKENPAAADAPVDVPTDKAASALDREIAIRQALEDQLEQLRTRIQTQDVEAANAKKELLAQVEAANRRAEEAEARANDAAAGPVVATPAAGLASPPPSVADESAMRVQQLERDVAEAKSVTADAVARADALQRHLDEAQNVPAVDPGAAAKVEDAMTQLADAQQRASAAEQRAASVESVRDELEVRVAQLGAKAGDLEQRATALEASLNEANAGGDAVRAEIATLTAALAAANAHVTELESAPAAATHNEENQAEIARLRGELAGHMERAQAAEERVATLEADVLAAERGVATLPLEAPAAGSANGASAPLATEPAQHDRLASRFEESEPDEEPARMPEPVVATEEHEPEVHEPEVRELAQATAESQTSDVEDVAGVVAESSTEPREAQPVNRWLSPSVPLQNVGAPVAASSIPDAASDTASSPESVEDDDPSPQREVVEQGSTDMAVPPLEPVEPDPSPLGSSRETAEPEVDAPTQTVEWHAPVATPDPVASTTSNGNGIPPAPSDDARYDDIWTAAFAPPEPQPEPATPAEVEREAADRRPEPEQPTPVASAPEQPTTTPSEPEQPTPVASAPEHRAPAPSEPEQPTAAASSTEAPTEDGVSPDDRPSPPEDELSAEDDMWSLRARLAEAATRRQLPHEID
ncbi:MAG TPA: hypothetical protein VJ736_02410 [Actinomycetota bacterium]|nr:hypothetical protein [Actinomycetota bacterium]